MTWTAWARYVMRFHSSSLSSTCGGHTPPSQGPRPPHWAPRHSSVATPPLTGVHAPLAEVHVPPQGPRPLHWGPHPSFSGSTSLTQGPHPPLLRPHSLLWVLGWGPQPPFSGPMSPSSMGPRLPPSQGPHPPCLGPGMGATSLLPGVSGVGAAFLLPVHTAGVNHHPLLWQGPNPYAYKSCDLFLLAPCPPPCIPAGRFLLAPGLLPNCDLPLHP